MSARRRFRIDALPDGPTRLPPGPAHHLLRVLRLGVGARVRVFDGQGQEREVEVSAVDADGVEVVPAGPVLTCAPAAPAHLFIASLKPKALDVALRMSVEAGVTHIHVFPTQRSIKRPPRLDRWSRITEAAAQQCGRADLPTLIAHDSLHQALAAAAQAGCSLSIALPGAQRRASPAPPAGVLIGPEGGFTASEVDRCLAAGAEPVGLGDWVLRADTAAAIASAWVAGH